MGNMAQHAGRFPHDGVHPLDAPLGKVLHLAELLRRKLCPLHHVVYIQPVRFIRRDPPRRGVRLLQISKLLQICHFVADGGRGDPERNILCNEFASDRSGGEDILVDDCF